MKEETYKPWDVKKPGISFNPDSGRISIYRTTLDVMKYPEFYRFLLNLEKKQLAIQSCGIDDSGAHRLPEIKDRETCDVSSMDLVRLLYRVCSWDRNLSYRVQGVDYPAQRTVTFDLGEVQKLNVIKQREIVWSSG